MNPEKQNILRSELLKILPEKDTPLTIENTTNMPYLRACIKEALRVMPITIGNLRSSGRNIVLKGYQIPKASIHFDIESTNLFLQLLDLLLMTLLGNHIFFLSILRNILLITVHKFLLELLYLPNVHPLLLI
uniref:Cytochrome P450 n=1 Tax=Phlebotomus papatasi TaxID=29031 RepID=A0A1B0D8J6_PHLPP